MSYEWHEYHGSSLCMQLIWRLLDILYFVTAGDLTEIGCFRDESTRALDGPTIDTDDMTNEKCVDYCSEQASVFGVCLFSSLFTQPKVTIHQVTIMLATSKNVLQSRS